MSADWAGGGLLLAGEVGSTGSADTSVVPGRRVGAITAYSSLAVLKAMYGSANIIPKMQPLPSGDTAPGVRLFAGTDRQLDLVWEEDGGREKRLAEVRIVGKAWALENGVKIGLTVSEVEKIIGKPVRITGAEGGPMAEIDGGATGAGFGLRFTPGASIEHKGRSGGKKKGEVEGEEHTPGATVVEIVIRFR